MTYTMSHGLTLAAMRSGTTELAAALLRRAVVTGDLDESTIQLAARRGDLDDELVEAVGKLSWELELAMAIHTRSPEVLDRLSRSRRRRTLTRLANRNDLPASAAERLAAKHSMPQVAAGGLAQGSLPTDVRLRYVCDQSSDGLLFMPTRWCSNDHEFARWYIEGHIALIAMLGLWWGDTRGAEPFKFTAGSKTRPAAVVLDAVPADASGPLTALAVSAIENSQIERISEWVQHRKPRGVLLDAVIGRIEEADGGDGTTPGSADVRRLVRAVLNTYSTRRRSATSNGVAPVWDSVGLDRAARSSCPDFACAALRATGIDPAVRRAAVFGDSSVAQAAVAWNRDLDVDEIDHLLSLPDHRFGAVLAGAVNLTDEQRVEIARRAAGDILCWLAESTKDTPKRRRNRDRGDGAARIEQWLEEDICVAVLEHRGGAQGMHFGEYAEIVLARHPHLARAVLASARPDDQLEASVAEELVCQLCTQITGDGSAEVFVNLLADWDGALDELALTAECVAAGAGRG